MREFFHGWRRKAGCITLVMAVMVFVIWMRSRLICDQFAYPQNDYQWTIFSADGCLSVYAAKLDPLEEGYTAWWSGENHRDDPSAPQLSLIVYRIRPAVWMLPYWMFVLPLTLLSTYLILWKPRTKVNRNA